MHRTMLSAAAVPAAIAGDVIAASVVTELANAGHLTVQFNFVRGSGGTTATYWLQTSLDGGATWIDIACVQFTTASAKQVFNIDAGGYVAPGYVPGDGVLAPGLVVDGILGDRLRIKQTIVGTYAASTISVDVVDKAGIGASKTIVATTADGADATQGAKADAAWQGEATASEIALLKTIAGVIGPAKRSKGLLTTALAVVPIPSGSKVAIVTSTVLARVGKGNSATPAVSVQERQTFTKGDATSGNFKAGFQGQLSGNLAYDITGANLVTGLVAMTSIGAGGVTLISGGPLNTTPIVVEFAAGILDGDQPLMTVTTVDLAGGVDAASRLPTVTISTAAVVSTGFAEANTPLAFALAATDTYLWLYGDATTGVYRVSFFS